MSDESSEQKFEELWTRYLEGEMDEAAMADFRQFLSEHPELQRRAEELYQTHRLLGFLAADDRSSSEQFVQATMQQLPADGDQFTSKVMQSWTSSAQQVSEKVSQSPAHQRPRPFTWAALSGFAALLIALLALWPAWKKERGNERMATANTDVHFTRLARAEFFGELTPSIQSVAAPRKDYILMKGMVELRFPDGATAILEAPAVFRVMDRERLAMDMGQCSVHAPPGAEGFRLDTPSSTVVDRGTRFVTRVNERSDTEVQVIEGEADVYPLTDTPSSRSREIKLREREGALVPSLDKPVASLTTYNAQSYRRALPDRLISYTATTSTLDGGAETLTGVTVQRGGEEIQYARETLISADLIWFKPTPGTKSPTHLIGPAVIPKDRRTLLLRGALAAGAINPGGSRQPLTADPVLAEGDNHVGTPGMAVRFARPVQNRPGPDVVFMETQPIPLPPEGDPFHVSPLHFTPGLKSLTVRNYDVNMLSPGALRVTRPHLYTGHAVHSLDDLLTGDFVSNPFRMVSRVVAVGIDLSDLGYSEGALVDGLFIQDAEDDDLRVDPIFIGGLP